MGLSISQMAVMSQLLDEALPLDNAGRRSWLERLSPEHVDIGPTLRRVLLPDESEIAAVRELDTLPKLEYDGDATARDASGVKIGARLGPYELIRRLGVGGMAEVWLARRADGAFKREVALKLPTKRHLRGDVEHRFIQERDILASLEHPLIARFYDAGIDPNGLPYFAMEYVRGERLTVWCDTHRLGVPERLKLILQTLDALQYAHAHLVVHRDLKPSNILVNEAGQVRLLDFGVARLLADDQEDSRLTVVYGPALTPEYASPEIARGECVQAASDVYSMGVVIYELLTGCLPYGVRGRASAEELEQSIVAAEVPMPSIHLAPDAGRSRSVGQQKLVRQLRGDLDAIVMKALAKNQGDRYGSAAELALDLQRYLDGQPVTARPNHFISRFGKLIQQRSTEVAVAAGALAIATLGYSVLSARHTALLSTTAVRASATAAEPDKSVAVLPFVDLSENKDQEYFSDGLSEELINHLSHSAGLKVIARTSSFQFKGRNEDARSIAVKLGVAHLLEGSVRKGGQAIRVTTQLIQASDGTQLWSRTYDRNLSDIFTVQDEIAESVAKALNATLAIVDQPVGRQSDVEAYNLVLEGNYYKARRTIPDVQKAVQLYQQAIDLRPNFALAWARLASAYFNLEDLKGTPSPQYNAKITAALDRAIALDPKLVWSYFTRAGFEMAVEWDWAAAHADHERIRALDPQSTYLLPSALGEMALVSGHVTEALEHYERVIQLNPLDALSLEAISAALCASNRLPECLQYRLKLQQLHPDYGGVNSSVGMARVYLGDLTAALANMEQEPEEDRRLAGLAVVYAAMGRHAQSDAALTALEGRFATTSAYEIAQIHAYRGEADQAFEWLQRSYRRHDSEIVWIKTDPLLRGLHGDRRFRELLTQLRLPE
jgi:TolB-like protein/tRNA A-37 threonylcarbamoyl transferase component Bud32